MSSERHCNTCTCGMTHVEWSDRQGWVDLSSAESLAGIVMNCSLDHSYDRTSDGIPWGVPDELRAKLAPVVAKHLSAVEPDWHNKTVYMDYEDGSRERFRQDLITALS